MFPSRSGKPAGLSVAIIKALSEAINQPISAHDWRRTFVTAALNAGVSLHLTEVLTGHKPSGITLRHYYAPSIDDLRAAVEKIDEYFCGGL